MGKDKQQKHHYYRDICCDECEALWDYFSKKFNDILNNQSKKFKQAYQYLIKSIFSEQDAHFILNFTIKKEDYLTHNSVSLKNHIKEQLEFYNSCRQHLSGCFYKLLSSSLD